jgi:hypothetical protein
MATYTFDEQIVSDLYKDVYGTRSMARGWSALSDDEKQTEWDYLLRRLDENMAEDRERELQAVARFEARITLTQALVANASERVDAIRIIGEAEDFDPRYGWEELEYRLGLPYGYITEPKPEVNWEQYD